VADLTIGLSWDYNKTGRLRGLAATTLELTLTGTGVCENMQTVGTAAHEALVLGEVATYGWLYARNSDGTNFVQLGYDDTGTFRPFIKLLAGEFCMVPLAAAPYAKADTGSVKLDYMITER
jgi:hypothetical protein